jgi:hypothetical protein
MWFVAVPCSLDCGARRGEGMEVLVQIPQGSYCNQIRTKWAKTTLRTQRGPFDHEIT